MIKVKFTEEEATKAQGGGGGHESSTLSLISSLDVGLVSSTPRPLYSRIRPGTYLYRGLGGPHGRSGRVRKISPPPRFDPRTVKSTASRYTDWAIPAHRRNNIYDNSTAAGAM